MKSKACLAPSRVNAVRVTGTLLVLLLPLVFYSNVTYADYTAVIERETATIRQQERVLGRDIKAADIIPRQRIDDEKRDRLLLVDPSSPPE